MSVLVQTNCTLMIQASSTKYTQWDRGETNPFMRQICSLYQPLVRFPVLKVEIVEDAHGLPVVSTVEHDLHKIRRAALNPYFSVRSVSQLESIIKAKVKMMCDQISRFKEQGKILSIRLAFSAAIIDITTEYCTLNGRRRYLLLEEDAKYLHSFCAKFSRLGRQHQMVGVGKHDLWRYRNGTSGASFSGYFARGSGVATSHCRLF